jgi:hypothetical protein
VSYFTIFKDNPDHQNCVLPACVFHELNKVVSNFDYLWFPCMPNQFFLVCLVDINIHDSDGVYEQLFQSVDGDIQDMLPINLNKHPRCQTVLYTRIADCLVSICMFFVVA